MGYPSEFRGLFPRTPSSARRARTHLVDVGRRWLAGSDLADFESAVGEALANAVQHGGGRSFYVRCEREAAELVVEIRDEGVGFDVTEELGVKPGDESPRGYGLFIMFTVLDGVEILDGGTRFRLIKRLGQPQVRAQSARDAG